MLASEEPLLLLHAGASYTSDIHACSWTFLFDNTDFAERATEQSINIQNISTVALLHHRHLPHSCKLSTACAIQCCHPQVSEATNKHQVLFVEL